MLSSPPYSCSVTIQNLRGLHARAAAKFVQTVNAHDATVHVIKDDLHVDGTAIMDLMLLSASQGTRLILEAEGPAAQDVLIALSALIKDRFHETE